jgi:hypothetical protein
MKRSRVRLVTGLSFICPDVCQARLTLRRNPGSVCFFDQLTVLKPKYTLGAKVPVNAMRREHHGYPRSPEILKHLSFVFIVQRGRCFVQEKQRDAAQDRSSESQPLPLSSREQDSIITNAGLEAQGKRGYKFT